MLKSLQEQAKEAKLEELKAISKQREAAILKQFKQNTDDKLNDFTSFFLTIQDKLDTLTDIQNKERITANELKNAFHSLYGNDTSKMIKEHLDLIG